jgi:DNA polymerase I
MEGKDNEDPIIKGLDGLADSNPLWIRKWFTKIVCEIVKRPFTRFEGVPKLLREAIFELEHDVCTSQSKIDKELKFTQRLRKYPNEYKQSVRAGRIGRLLEKDKGEEIQWFETKHKDKDTGGNYSVITPESKNLNLQKYKIILLDKLKDTLEIVGFDMADIKSEILLKTLPIEHYR